MSGKKPTQSGFAIVRGFRGEMLYLASVHTGNGFRWVAGKDSALVIADADEAAAIAERASREYGAKTTVVDMQEAAHVIVVPGYTSKGAQLLQSVMARVAERNPDASVFTECLCVGTLSINQE